MISRIQSSKNFIVVCTIILFMSSCKQKEENTTVEVPLTTTIDSTLYHAAEQYKFLGKQIEAGEYPKTYYADKDELETSNSGWWCSGFYPGSLLYLYEAVGDSAIRDAAIATFDDLQKEQFNTHTHDLGFMMFCSFGNALRLDKNPEYEQILINSAKSLSTRYNDTVQAIRSWDSHPANHATEEEMAVIIDNMMNLELLFWATKVTGDSTYYNIAETHANTTIKNHFREDNSSYHQLIYRESDGSVRAKITAQGAADSSAWARGQAWGLYGYTVMYRETRDTVYLEQAQKIADFILQHPHLPEDMIPYWDFNAPNIPDAERDSSAGAIIASALLELSQYTEGDRAEKYLASSETILRSLLTPEYIAETGQNGGFLLKHGVGHKPANSEVDVPLSYGDYYLIEAMLRYKDMAE